MLSIHYKIKHLSHENHSNHRIQPSQTNTNTLKKQFLFAGLLAFCSAIFALVSCSDTPAERRQDAAQDAKENLKDAKEDLKDAGQEVSNALKAERDDLSARMNQTGRDLDVEIEALDRKIEKASAKEKTKWQERRNTLAAQRDELKSDMNRIGEDMKDGWSDFKTATAKKLDKISADLKED